MSLQFFLPEGFEPPSLSEDLIRRKARINRAWTLEDLPPDYHFLIVPGNPSPGDCAYCHIITDFLLNLAELYERVGFEPGSELIHFIRTRRESVSAYPVIMRQMDGNDPYSSFLQKLREGRISQREAHLHFKRALEPSDHPEIVCGSTLFEGNNVQFLHHVNRTVRDTLPTDGIWELGGFAFDTKSLGSYWPRMLLALMDGVARSYKERGTQHVGGVLNNKIIQALEDVGFTPWIKLPSTENPLRRVRHMPGHEEEIIEFTPLWVDLDLLLRFFEIVQKERAPSKKK